MKHTKLFIVLVVVLLLASFVSADEDMLTECIDDEECFLAFGEAGYCNFDTGTCWVIEDEDPPGDEEIPDNETQGNETEADVITSEEELLFLEEELFLQQQALLEFQERVGGVEDISATLQSQLGQLAQSVAHMNLLVQDLSEQQAQGQEDIAFGLNNVATGLAAVQQDLGDAQEELADVEISLEEEQRTTRFFSWIISILVAIAVTLMIVLYVTQREGPLDPKIRAYITRQVRAGKKFPEIKQSLIESGWSEQQASWAYQKTTKKNYERYVRLRGGKKKGPVNDKQKMMFIVLVSILLILGVLFLLRGASTGHAIYFDTYSELRNAVEETLEFNVEKNDFYEKIEFATICVEVVDGPRSVSYKVVKTLQGPSIEEAPKSCSEDERYDFAAKFNSFDNFRELAADLTCESAGEMHTNGVYVLPSKHVLPGFELNPESDISDFCDAIGQCLSSSEKKEIGC